METNNQNILYTWSFDDSKERGTLWYTIAFSIILGIIIWGFLTSQYMLSFAAMLFPGLYIYYQNNSESIVEVALGDKGIYVAKSFFPYEQISNFTIIYDKDIPVYVMINFLKSMKPYLLINIDQTIVNDVKFILGQFITENPENQISFTEKIIHKLKI